MLRVTVEMVPFGDEARAYTLAEGIIYNDGTGNRSSGNYVAEFNKSRTSTRWKKVRLTGYPRLRKSVWHLVYRCLRLMVNDTAGQTEETAT